jgi:DNA-binding MarR family transcriptional regulator
MPSTPTDAAPPSPPPAAATAAALLRRPVVHAIRHVMAALRDAGFDDLLPAHLGVFQYPGPEGSSPGALAWRTSTSKQAMNHLLQQLDSRGYLTREPHPEDRRARAVRLTGLGWAAYAVIEQTLSRLDRTWHDALDDETYHGLALALSKLHDVLDAGNGRGA